MKYRIGGLKMFLPHFSLVLNQRGCEPEQFDLFSLMDVLCYQYKNYSDIGDTNEAIEVA